MLRFFKITRKTCGKIRVCICLLKVHFNKRSEKDLFDDVYAIFFSDSLYTSTCCGYSFELHRQVDAIQMGSHNICLQKRRRQKIHCNLKTTKLLDCALIGVCAVNRTNTVIQ